MAGVGGVVVVKPWFTDSAVTVYAGDCLDVLRELPACSVDAVVTDPPYGLGFMGKQWDQPWQQTRRGGTGGREFTAGTTGHDHRLGRERSASMHAGEYDLSLSAMRGFQSWCEQWARECLRVLKPGGHMLAFGGSRTWHRLACAVEDAGFEIRDSIAWLYGSGFPKSLDVSKAIDKAAGVEGEWVQQDHPGRAGARTRPGDIIGQTDHRNADNPDGLRHVYRPGTEDGQEWQGWGTALKPAFEPIIVGRKPLAGTVAANVLAHGTGALNIDACRTGMSAEDAAHDAGRWPTNVVLDDMQAAELDRQSGNVRSAGASRFFPTFRYEAKAPTTERPRVGEVSHPTVKPLDLMRWLVRLVTPPGGTVLDPFLGSGTTAEACMVEGFRCVGIEREEAYLPLIKSRLDKPIEAVLL